MFKRLGWLVVVVAFAACSAETMDPTARAWQAMSDAQRYADNGQFQKADDEYDLAARLEPSLAAKAYYQKGRVLLDNGQPSAAEVAFTQAIALNPDDADAFWYRGFANARLGREAHAKADEAIARQLDPNVGNEP
jgi:tetratricopeptide (TPR) repeat protein